MAQSEIVMVVYDPPAVGLPYLAVAIFPDGEAAATGYATAAEAHNHVVQNAESAIRRIQSDNA